MTPLPLRAARGASLIEVMVALVVLLIGLLGMLRLHVVGLRANAGGRMHTQAVEIARELVGGIERLPFTDSRLADSGTGPTHPSTFGWVVQSDGTVASSGVAAWSDGQAIPGVRLSTELPAGYTRRWTVWGYRPGTTVVTATRVVAVSVAWKDPAIGRPQEVVLFTQVPNPAALMSGLAANQ